MAGGGETAREESAWTVDSTRDWIDDVHLLRDRVDMWRDRLYDEREMHGRELDALREAHRREVSGLREQMDAQRFSASQEANAQLAAANAEKFAGFPQQYALRGETTAKIETLERTIAELVAASQTRVGQESGVATQRVEVAAQQDRRKMSTQVLVGIGALVFTVLNVVLPLVIRGLSGG